MGACADRVRNRIGEARTWQERFTILDDEGSAHAPSNVDGKLTEARRPRSSTPGGCCTAATARSRCRRLADRTVGYSERRLSTLFDAEIGSAPKTAARVIRFDRARRVVQTAEPGAAHGAIAAEHGYSDQSHLVRDFVAFTGRSPTRLARRGVRKRPSREQRNAPRPTTPDPA